MRKVTYIFVLLIAVFITSCDRFEHTFAPENTVDIDLVLFEPLQNSFATITATDVSAVMAFYADDYLHNSQLKADREDFYRSLFQKADTLNFQVNLIATQAIGENDTLSTSTWQLKVTNTLNQVIADSTWSDEKLVKRGNNWLLYGNRTQCCPPVTYQQRVFIETFTYTTCPNCPIVEALLHQLQLSHPNNLTYLEYHVNDPLDMGNLDVYGYYGYPAMPSVIFQGETKIIGNNADNEEIFNQLVTQLAATDSKIDLTYLDYSFSGQTLTGSIRLTINDETIDPAQLKLKYAIIDKETDPEVYHNSQLEACRNVVLAKGTKSLLDADLSQPLNFNLPFGTLPSGYNGSLPIDSYLVVWVQVTPDPYNVNATIYNALESPITVNKKHWSK
jgi:hypothetical protein